jgi:hypothetical protein
VIRRFGFDNKGAVITMSEVIQVTEGGTMTIQTFALIMGIVYVAAGVLGFFPSTPPPAALDVTVTLGYGYLFGLFPINLLHNLVHLGIGLWGLGAYRSLMGAQNFARGLTAFYGVLAVMGLIPVLNTTFGLIPIFGHDVWLHAVTAALASYFGFGRRAIAMSEEPLSRIAS